jgi:SpoVK/Ycf46/Vps4 family AAA+-type ATPase
MTPHPSLAAQICIQADVPFIVWGPPGCGKTEILRSVAEAMNRKVEAPRLSSADPTDIDGIPIIVGRSYNKAPAQYIRNLSQEVLGDAPGFLFFDELSQCPPSVQNSAMDGFHTKEYADVPLGSRVSIGGAANPTDTTSGTFDLTSTFSNRVCHLQWKLDYRTWIQAMRSVSVSMDSGKVEIQFPTPPVYLLDPQWHQRIPHWFNLLATFIECQPSKMLVEPENDLERGRPWPSNRSIEKLGGRLLAASESFGLDVQCELLEGCVGGAWMTEFSSWLRALDLPNPEDLLLNPKLFTQPEEGMAHRTYAVLSSVIAALRSNLTEKRWIQAWAVLVWVSQWQEDIVLPFAFQLDKDVSPKPQPQVPLAARQIIGQMASETGMLAPVRS